MDGWVKFTADGTMPRYTRDEVENGSSYAVARVAAYGAYLHAVRPEVGRDDMVAAMRAATTVDENGVSDMSAWKTVERFRIAMSSQPVDVAAMALSIDRKSLGR